MSAASSDRRCETRNTASDRKPGEATLATELTLDNLSVFRNGYGGQSNSIGARRTSQVIEQLALHYVKLALTVLLLNQLLATFLKGMSFSGPKRSNVGQITTAYKRAGTGVVFVELMLLRWAGELLQALLWQRAA